jgi:hypothetical protein
MQFGYFTPSDNHHDKQRQGRQRLRRDITDDVVYAEEVGLHSA